MATSRPTFRLVRSPLCGQRSLEAAAALGRACTRLRSHPAWFPIPSSALMYARHECAAAERLGFSLSAELALWTQRITKRTRPPCLTCPCHPPGKTNLLDSVREVVMVHKDRYIVPVILGVTRASGEGMDSIFMGAFRVRARPISVPGFRCCLKLVGSRNCPPQRQACGCSHTMQRGTQVITSLPIAHRSACGCHAGRDQGLDAALRQHPVR